MVRSSLFLCAFVALLLVGCGAMTVPDGYAGGTAAPSGPQAVFPSVTVKVELAQTPAAREKGLGGHAPLGDRDGMLFIFEQPGIYPFWMKGMTFPLDIMWIDGGKVVHLEANLPQPRPTDADQALPIYTPKAAARYVLEVNAGFAKAHDISLGTPVQFKGLPG